MLWAARCSAVRQSGFAHVTAAYRSRNGGLGAGVSFRDGQLLFNGYTSVFYYLLAPRNIGDVPSAELLYMTSSNRASKGCEALLSFFRSEQFQTVFRVWDWATPPQADGS